MISTVRLRPVSVAHEHGMISCAADGLLHQHSVERLIAQRPT